MIVVGTEKGRDSDHPIGSRPIFHDDGLPPALGESLRKQPSAEIRSAPRRHGCNYMDSPTRPVGSNDSRTPANDAAQEQGDGSNGATGKAHGILLERPVLARF